MKLSPDELQKFAEVFVEIYEYNTKVEYDSKKSELIINKVNEDILENWKRYLNDTCESYEDDIDAFDKWFDELDDINKIDSKDLSHYNLPTSIIEIRLGNEETFMRKLLELAKTFIENNKPYCTEKNQVGAAYQFTKQAVYVMVYTYSKKANAEALNKAKQNFKVFFEAAKALGKEFNDIQGNEPHIGIGSSINDSYLMGNPVYERTFAIDDGCDTLYYPHTKKRVTQEYSDKFYGSVPEESVVIGQKFVE